MVVPDRHPTCDVRVKRLGSLEVGESCKQVSCSARGKHDPATPDVRSGICLEVEAGDYAEVVLPAFQGGEEVGSGCCVGVDDFAAREYDFEVDDRVAGPAVLGGKK